MGLKELVTDVKDFIHFRSEVSERKIHSRIPSYKFRELIRTGETRLGKAIVRKCDHNEYYKLDGGRYCLYYDLKGKLV